MSLAAVSSVNVVCVGDGCGGYSNHCGGCLDLLKRNERTSALSTRTDAFARHNSNIGAVEAARHRSPSQPSARTPLRHRRGQLPPPAGIDWHRAGPRTKLGVGMPRKTSKNAGKSNEKTYEK